MMTTMKFLKVAGCLILKTLQKVLLLISPYSQDRGSKPAQLALSASEFTHMQDYLDFIRPTPKLDKAFRTNAHLCHTFDMCSIPQYYKYKKW